MTTEEYKDRIDDINVAYANVVEDMKSFMTRLYGVADSAGIENPTLMSPDELLTELNKRVIMLNRKDLAEIRDALRTIGYNDTEIEQCLADVPDLTMADIDYARTFAEGWTVGKKTYGSSDINDLKLRIMPKVDYSEATSVSSLFQKATNLEYIPTLDWPKVTTASYVFHDLRKLRRCPQINAPEAVNISSLYSAYNKATGKGGFEILPAVISHPKATNVASLFNGATHEALATIQTLDLNYGIITNAAQIYRDSGVDTFMLTEFTAPVKLSHAYWTQADYGYISNIKGDQSGTKWNIPHVTDISGAFYSCNATAIDVSGIKTAECTSFDSVFNNTANLRSLDVSMWDVSAGESMRWVFTDSGVEVLNFSHKRFKEGANLVSLCEDMPRLRELILTDVDFTNTADQTCIDAYFYNLPSLETIIGPVTGLHNAVYLADSPLLTVESAMVIINGLADITGSGRALGLYLHASAYNRLTPEQIAVATSKGWRVVKNA